MFNNTKYEKYLVKGGFKMNKAQVKQPKEIYETLLDKIGRLVQEAEEELQASMKGG